MASKHVAKSGVTSTNGGIAVTLSNGSTFKFTWLFWVAFAGMALLIVVLWKNPQGRTIAILLSIAIVMIWLLIDTPTIVNQIKGL